MKKMTKSVLTRTSVLTAISICIAPESKLSAKMITLDDVVLSDSAMYSISAESIEKYEKSGTKDPALKSVLKKSSMDSCFYFHLFFIIPTYECLDLLFA